jgi:16S rRNA (guanine527-N7)-methyltransferase
MQRFTRSPDKSAQTSLMNRRAKTRTQTSASVPDLAADRERALALTPVSRETSQRLDRYVELLLAWQRTTNLIAPSTIPHLWTRHIADSLQLLELIPDAAPPAKRKQNSADPPPINATEPALVWTDLGTGAGFPGLVLAAALAEIPGTLVHLVESNAKKAAFLREAVRVTGAPARVHAARVEDVLLTLTPPPQVITARALAPLTSLLDRCAPLLGKSGAVALFPKGQNAELELAEAAKWWDMNALLVPSRTDPAGRIVVVRDVARKAKSQ